MEESIDTDVDDIQEEDLSRPVKQNIKLKGFDAHMNIGRTSYGDRFQRYNKIDEIRDLIPTFKEFYYKKKMDDPELATSRITREFNMSLPADRTFCPYHNNLKGWVRKWDVDIKEQLKIKAIAIATQRDVQQVISTRRDGEYLVASDGELEMGTRTLAGELLNDALGEIKDSQAFQDIYTVDELVKKKNYAVNVLAHVGKIVQTKAALALKAKAEKREEVGWMMDLLRKATAGTLSNEEMGLLKSSYVDKKIEANEPS